MSESQRLQPWSLTDLLDVMFWLYRRNFGTLLLISVLVQVPAMLMVSQIQPWIYQAVVDVGRLWGLFTLWIGVGMGTLYAMFAGSLLGGALISAVDQIRRGQPTSLRAAFAAGLPALPALIPAALVTGLLNSVVDALISKLLTPIFFFPDLLSAVLLLLCSLVLGLPLMVGVLLLYARLLIAAQAIVLERCGPLAGLRRSWQLTRGALRRTLPLAILLVCFGELSRHIPYALLWLIPGASFDPNSSLLYAIALLSGAFQVLITPLSWIAYTLLYIDQRSRSEGYDLEQRLEAAGYPPTPC